MSPVIASNAAVPAAAAAAAEKKTPSVVIDDEATIEYNVSASTLAKMWSRRALYTAFTW